MAVRPLHLNFSCGTKKHVPSTNFIFLFYLYNFILYIFNSMHTHELFKVYIGFSTLFYYYNFYALFFLYFLFLLKTFGFPLYMFFGFVLQLFIFLVDES